MPAARLVGACPAMNSASSASASRDVKPVCFVISTKPVGLVTFTGQKVALDVSPTTNRPSLRADALGDSRSRGEHARPQPAGREVASRLAELRDPRQRMQIGRPSIRTIRLSPSAISGMALRHRSRTVVRQRLDDHIPVGIVDADPENRCASHAVERL